MSVKRGSCNALSRAFMSIQLDAVIALWANRSQELRQVTESKTTMLLPVR
jgi:hypothetical protein